jgi:hypothetical protein
MNNPHFLGRNYIFGGQICSLKGSKKGEKTLRLEALSNYPFPF